MAALGADALGLDEKDKQTLLELVKRLAFNTKILREGKALLDALGVPTIDLDSDLSFVAAILEAADPLKLFDEAGLERWRSDRSGSIYDQMPKEYSDMIQVLEAICSMLDGQVGEVSGEALERIVQAIMAHMSDRKVVTLGLKALSKLSTNRANMLHLARYAPTAECLRDSLQTHADDVRDEGVCRWVADLTKRLAHHGGFRKRFGPMGIPAIIEALVRFRDNRILVTKCVGALGALSKNMPANVNEMHKCDIFDALRKVLDTWTRDYGVIIEVCFLLSMLMHVVEDLAIDACNAVAEPLITVLTTHCVGLGGADAGADADAGDGANATTDADADVDNKGNRIELLKMVARALGSMSCVGDAVPFLLEKGIVSTLLNAVKAPMPGDASSASVLSNAEAAQTVIDVIGNLALGDPEEDDGGDEGRLDPTIS